MKHMKIFEEHGITPIKNFFKDKINWKDFNYLLDKITKYEDQGNTVVILICVNPGEVGYMNVFNYHTGTELHYNDKYISGIHDVLYKTLMKGYFHGGLYYRIYGGDNELLIDLPEKLYSEVKDRFDRVEGAEEGELWLKCNSPL